MTSLHDRFTSVLGRMLAFAALSSTVWAAPARQPSSVDSSKSSRPQAQPAPAAPSATDPITRLSEYPENSDEVVKLQAFQVNTSSDLGYQSSSTLSGTRTNERLRDLSVPVSVLNADLIRDVAATDFFQVLNFGIGVESSQSIPGVGTGSGGGSVEVRFRGITSTYQSRDNFQWYVPSDMFNIERLEVNRGPTGQLFGDTRAGGILNIVSKRALNRNATSLNTLFDSEGTRRGTVDANLRLNERLALRVNLMASDVRDWRDTNSDERWGVALAGNYRLADRTTLRWGGEMGDINRIPSTRIPTDEFSDYRLGTGSIAPSAPAGTRTMQGAGNNQRWTIVDGKLINYQSTSSTFFRETFANSATIGPVSPDVIPRPQQWNGPSDRLDNKYYVYTLELEHFVNDNLGFLLAHNVQNAFREDIFANWSAIRRDPNPQIPNSAGVPGLIANPDYEKLYVEHQHEYLSFKNVVRNYLATGVYQHDFGFTQQKLIVSGSVRDERFRLRRLWDLLTPETISAAGLTGNAALPLNNRVRRRYYLEDGNDDALARRDTPGSRYYELANGQLNRPQLWNANALLISRYFEDRLITNVGVRRDNYETVRVNMLADPVTGLGYLERDANGDLLWRETAGIYVTSMSYGAVVSPAKWFRLFANYAENFQFNGTGTYFNLESRLPRIGEGYDYGASVYLLNDRLNATVTFFDAAATNETTGNVPGTVVAEMNNLLGTTYVSAGDTRDQEAKGYEVELVANPTRNWTLTAKYSYRENQNSNFLPRVRDALARMRTATTDSSLYVTTENYVLGQEIAAYSDANNWNFTTRYTFTEGTLKGLRVGTSGYFREGPTVLSTVRPSIKYDDYFMLNVFAGYKHRFGKYSWDIQLNIDNVLDLQTRVGNSFTNVSYLAPRLFKLQNSISF